MAVTRPMKKRMFIMAGLVLVLVAALALGKFLQIRKMTRRRRLKSRDLP